MTRLRRARLTALAAAAVMVLALMAVGAFGETIQTGNVLISVEGGITPTALPRTGQAPTTLQLSSTIRTVDHSRVPILKSINLEFDKHGSIDTKGLPTCSVAQLQGTLTAQAKQICGKALVGTGNAGAEIAFPEQPPFNASGPMLIFNGKPRGGRPVLIVHVHANVPAPTTFVTTGVVEKPTAKHGPSIQIAIPTIVNGQGSLISFNAIFHKIIRGSCPAPGGLPGAQFPFVKARFNFAEGQTATSVLVRQCKVKG